MAGSIALIRWPPFGTNNISVCLVRATILGQQFNGRRCETIWHVLIAAARSDDSLDGADRYSGAERKLTVCLSSQVTLFQLAEVTLLLSVLNKRSLKRRELLGWISLGFDSSAEQQNVHWQEMREAAGEQICHWHALLPP